MLTEGHAPHFDKPDSISSCNFGPRKFTHELLNDLFHTLGRASTARAQRNSKQATQTMPAPAGNTHARPELKELARKAKPGQARENTRSASNPGLARDQHPITMEQPLKP